MNALWSPFGPWHLSLWWTNHFAGEPEPQTLRCPYLCLVFSCQLPDCSPCHCTSLHAQAFIFSPHLSGRRRPREGMVGLFEEGTWNICNYGFHCCTQYSAERSPLTKTWGRLLTVSTGSKQWALASPRPSVINCLLLGEFAWRWLLHYKMIRALVMAFLVNNAKKPFG